MKKFTKYALSLMMVIAGLSAGLTGCNKESSLEDLSEANYVNVLSTQAVTSLDMLESNGIATLANLQVESNVRQLTNSEESKFKSTFESIIEQGKVVLQENLDVEVKESDIEKYKYLIEVDRDGEIYQVYVENLREEVEDDEKEYHYTGIVKYKEMEFSFVAEEEIEKEWNEEESSIEFMLKIDENTTLIIEQSYEKEGKEVENSYEFMIKRGNKVIQSYTLEREETNNGYEIECQINELIFKLDYDMIRNTVEIKTNEFRKVVSLDEIDFAQDDAMKDFFDKVNEGLSGLIPQV